jgi:multicomponent Na+:H+ antiporter subunit G
MLVSAVGLLRLPDVFSRMHAAGNASTLGVGCLLLSAGVHFWDQNLFFRMVLLIGLIFATGPISTAAMARAAYRTGTPKGMHLKIDQMGDKELG